MTNYNDINLPEHIQPATMIKRMKGEKFYYELYVDEECVYKTSPTTKQYIAMFLSFCKDAAKQWTVFTRYETNSGIGKVGTDKSYWNPNPEIIERWNKQGQEFFLCHIHTPLRKKEDKTRPFDFSNTPVHHLEHVLPDHVELSGLSRHPNGNYHLWVNGEIILTTAPIQDDYVAMLLCYGQEEWNIVEQYESLAQIGTLGDVNYYDDSIGWISDGYEFFLCHIDVISNEGAKISFNPQAKTINNILIFQLYDCYKEMLKLDEKLGSGIGSLTECKIENDSAGIPALNMWNWEWTLRWVINGNDDNSGCYLLESPDRQHKFNTPKEVYCFLTMWHTNLPWATPIDFSKIFTTSMKTAQEIWLEFYADKGQKAFEIHPLDLIQWLFTKNYLN